MLAGRFFFPAPPAPVRRGVKTGPNEPCPCGSGKKYKKCHGSPTATARPAAPAAGTAVDWLRRGQQLEAAGRLPEAESCYQQALQRDGRHAETWLALGRLAEKAGDFDVAHASYERLVSLHPNHAMGHFVLGNTLVRRLDFTAARAAYLRAVELDPGLAGPWFNLGNLEGYLGRGREALAFHRRAIALNADPVQRWRQHSHVLITLHRDETLTPEELFREHLRWAEENTAGLPPPAADWPNSREPERPLRLGYVSGSFNGQIVGHFLPHVLEHHNRGDWQVTLYSSTRGEDDATRRFRAAADAWVDIGALDDDAAAARVRADGIDILVDIDGHSPTGRPLLFARKPAPLQVSWLDWFNTTGLATMDYILTDPYTTPVGGSQRFAEEPYRLPHTRFCYRPPEFAPPVAPPPLAAGAPLTFGSFNRQDKLHPLLLARWAEILHSAPESRLLLKNRALGAPAVRQEIAKTFAQQGVAPERLLLRGPSDHAAMLAEYAEVDIALDPYPYNGGLTTCECLWMGVPIIALEGERMIGRQTAAMLRLLGLDDWVASRHDDYVRLAVAKAADRAALADLRQRLRPLMAASPLVDAAGFCRDLEAAFRDMWRRYCR